MLIIDFIAVLVTIAIYLILWFWSKELMQLGRNKKANSLQNKEKKANEPNVDLYRAKLQRIRQEFQKYIGSRDQGVMGGLPDFYEPAEGLKWMNLVRTEPRRFADLVREQLSRMNSDGSINYDGKLVQTK